MFAVNFLDLKRVPRRVPGHSQSALLEANTSRLALGWGKNLLVLASPDPEVHHCNYFASGLGLGSDKVLSEILCSFKAYLKPGVVNFISWLQ